LKFTATTLPAVFLIELEKLEDERGYFARTFCSREFAERGLSPAVSQCSISRNTRAGTLRGMHYQEQPHAEAKLVRCSRGAIYDVVLDLRPHSPSYRAWYAAELSADNGRMLYVPEGCAHGFQTLSDDTEISYQISTPYVPQAARGVRWDDPAFAIAWPRPVAAMSERDRTYPSWQPPR
jgi:dTDP-4-dehydrorhamnose 3,5-epimerase